jgi:hypothetical protein
MAGSTPKSVPLDEVEQVQQRNHDIVDAKVEPNRKKSLHVSTSSDSLASTASEQSTTSSTRTVVNEDDILEDLDTFFGDASGSFAPATSPNSVAPSEESALSSSSRRQRRRSSIFMEFGQAFKHEPLHHADSLTLGQQPLRSSLRVKTHEESLRLSQLRTRQKRLQEQQSKFEQLDSPHDSTPPSSSSTMTPSLASTSATESWPSGSESSGRSLKKSVAFESIEIREYPIILGK